MFNIGFSEFMVIGIVALIFIGPKQLPEVAKVIGRLIGELKKATQDLSGGLLEVTRDVKESIEETKEGIIRQGQELVEQSFEPEPQNKEAAKLEPSGQEHTDKEKG